MLPYTLQRLLLAARVLYRPTNMASCVSGALTAMHHAGCILTDFKYEYLQNPNGEPRQLDCSKYISKYIIESLRSKAISLGSLLYQNVFKIELCTDQYDNRPPPPPPPPTLLHNDNLKQLQTAWRLKYRPPSDYPKTPPKDAPPPPPPPPLAKAREFWLLGQSEDALVTHFQPQPWRQLALTLQRQGYDREARRTFYPAQDLGAQGGRPRRSFLLASAGLLQRFLADYGFNLVETVILVCGLRRLLYGGLLWWTSGNHPMPGDAHTRRFSR